ncbi:MAG: lipid-binding protein [Flavobacteriaceae bacterium]|nr:lipid-binding protein [Flavobacteriaceae bacterium]
MFNINTDSMKYFINIFLLLIACPMFLLGQTATLDIESSNLKWTGKKITNSSHYGSLKFKSGEVKFSNGIIESGKFVVDMTTINVEDIEGRGKSRLEGHLKGDDFFSVEDFKEATLVINSSSKNGDSIKVMGTLTIKDLNSDVEFDMNKSGEIWTADLTFDRSKHNVRFRSGSFFENLGDNLILDDIELNAKLSFN